MRVDVVFEKKGGGRDCVLWFFYPLIMAFMVGLRFRLWLMFILSVSGSRSIVTVMAPLLCMIRWGLSSTLIHSLGTLSKSNVVPSSRVALAVRTCILIMV